ncbi:MAG: hypothetical protein ILO10_00950 [Kiritimatiellae bacterium]|nr:hypothetical protein [Kiritimatiellia bacterium]
MLGMNVWRRAALAALLLLLLTVGAGCSREKDEQQPAGEPPVRPGQKVEVRREFVVLREVMKQLEIQREAGNEARLAAVERYLGEWLAKVPDEGENEEEREILRRARAAQ